jgi:NADH:ubiquinone oxidoreductase subunit K
MVTRTHFNFRVDAWTVKALSSMSLASCESAVSFHILVVLFHRAMKSHFT